VTRQRDWQLVPAQYKSFQDTNRDLDEKANMWYGLTSSSGKSAIFLALSIHGFQRTNNNEINEMALDIPTDIRQIFAVDMNRAMAVLKRDNARQIAVDAIHFLHHDCEIVWLAVRFL